MPRFINQIKNMNITTPPDINNIKPKEQIKFVGYLFNGRGNIDNQINATSSTIGGLFHIAYKFQKNMPQPARKAFVYAHILSCLNYILPFCAGRTNKNKDKRMKIMVKSAKFIYG